MKNMKTLKITIVLVCLISLVGCLDNSTDPEPIVEPLGRSYYYVDNQSQSDLNVVYKIADFPVDSAVVVPADTTVKIFQLARSSSPTPSEAFGNLRFYTHPGDTTSPILTIEPVVDENWNRTIANDTAKYELVITKEDLPNPTKSTTATET